MRETSGDGGTIDQPGARVPSSQGAVGAGLSHGLSGLVVDNLRAVSYKPESRIGGGIIAPDIEGPAVRDPSRRLPKVGGRPQAGRTSRCPRALLTPRRIELNTLLSLNFVTTTRDDEKWTVEPGWPIEVAHR